MSSTIKGYLESPETDEETRHREERDKNMKDGFYICSTFNKHLDLHICDTVHQPGYGSVDQDCSFGFAEIELLFKY